MSGRNTLDDRDEYFDEVERTLPRLRELLLRLVAPGPKAEHVSASETHEICDFALETIEAFHEARKIAIRAEAAEKRAAALVEIAEEMIGYVPQYFVDKHNFRKELDALLASTVPR